MRQSKLSKVQKQILLMALERHYADTHLYRSEILIEVYELDVLYRRDNSESSYRPMWIDAYSDGYKSANAAVTRTMKRLEKRNLLSQWSNGYGVLYILTPVGLNIAEDIMNADASTRERIQRYAKYARKDKQSQSRYRRAFLQQYEFSNG